MTVNTVDTLEKQVAAQANAVRELKSAKAEKAVITAEVAKLLDLKKQLAAAQAAAPAADTVKGMSAVETLEKNIADQGNVVRDLKAAKAEKAGITAEVAKLLDLKKQLAAAQGDASAAAPAAESKKGKDKIAAAAGDQNKSADSAAEGGVSKGQAKKDAKKAEKAAKRASEKEEKGGDQQAESEGPDFQMENMEYRR